MAETYAVAIEGLSSLGDLDNLPKNILLNAQRAVNATVRHARQSAADDIYRRVKYPRGYLEGKSGRLQIAKFASGKDLEGIIVGRDQPTSLARFIVGGARAPGKGAPRDKGVTVQVSPGIAKRMPGAFVIKLKNNNLGLAVRSPKAPSPWAKRLSNNLWLLYGFSVDQAFRLARERIAAGEEEFMEREFERLMGLDL